MNAPVRTSPAGLWSLWDMLTLLDRNLSAAVVNLSIMADRLFRLRQEAIEPVQLHAAHIDAIGLSVALIEQSATSLRFAASPAAAQRLRDLLSNRHPEGWWSINGLNGLAHACSQAAQSFQDEMQAQSLFVLPVMAADLLSPSEPHFGKAVDDAFPLAAEDIEEAAKCLAFGRYTATAFHLMRAMEAAVQKLAAELGVIHVDKEWGKLLADIEGAVKAMSKGPDRDRWSESHSHLYHVKQAWRNNTMHPKKTYTEDEARSVYQAVKSFMTHLASLVAP